MLLPIHVCKEKKYKEYRWFNNIPKYVWKSKLSYGLTISLLASVLTWIQTVWHSDSVPEIIFEKVIFNI